MHRAAEVRVLLVDDFEVWRRTARSILRARHYLHVVGEAADGIEAVHKAQELHPDLILMDLGLPTMNGIDASVRISQVAPATKILFVSENRDLDVARAAFSAGACGYVLKREAGHELLPAIEAVVAGEKFVSSELQG